MKKIDIIYGDIIEYTAQEVLKAKNISKSVVVFPNIRAGYYLRKKILDNNKKTSLLPFIYSIDDFIKKRLFLKVDFELVDTSDMIFILYKNFKEEFCNLFSRNLTTDEFFDYAKIIINDFEELKINSINKQNIKPYDFLIRDGILNLEKDNVFEKYDIFSELYDKFYRFMYNSNKFSRSMIYEKYSEISDNFDDIEILIFSGFFAFTYVEKKIFKNIYKNSKSCFIFSYHPLLKDKISFFDLSIDFEKDIYKDLNGKNIEIVGVLNKHEQVFLLKNKLKEINDYDSTAIIIPDASDIIILLENLLGDVSKFNISAGFSIKYSPLFSIIKDLRNLFKNSVVRKSKRYFNYTFLERFILNNHLRKIVSKNLEDKMKKIKSFYVISVILWIMKFFYLLIDLEMLKIFLTL